MQNRFRLQLVSYWRDAWRFWSVRLNALGLALMSVDYVAALGVWNMLPHDARAVLPVHFLQIVGTALFALSMVSRIIRQPKVEERLREVLNPRD